MPNLQRPLLWAWRARQQDQKHWLRGHLIGVTSRSLRRPPHIGDDVACLHRCVAAGVDRVFVEHPIFDRAARDIYGANYTYVDSDAGVPTWTSVGASSARPRWPRPSFSGRHRRGSTSLQRRTGRSR